MYIYFVFHVFHHSNNFATKPIQMMWSSQFSRHCLGFWISNYPNEIPDSPTTIYYSRTFSIL